MIDSAFKDYENLAVNVIIRAAKDYRLYNRAFKRLMVDKVPKGKAFKRWAKKCNKYHAGIKEIEEFFCSTYFATISDADGPAMLKDLQKEVGR